MSSLKPSRITSHGSAAMLSVLSMLVAPAGGRLLAAETPPAPATQPSGAEESSVKKAQRKLELYDRGLNVMQVLGRRMVEFNNSPGAESLKRMEPWLYHAINIYPDIAKSLGHDSEGIKQTLTELLTRSKTGNLENVNECFKRLQALPFSAEQLDHEISSLQRGLAVGWINETRDLAVLLRKSLKVNGNGFLADGALVKRLEENLQTVEGGPHNETLNQLKGECRKAFALLAPSSVGVEEGREVLLSGLSARSLSTMEHYLRPNSAAIKPIELLPENTERLSDGNLYIKGGSPDGIMNEFKFLLKLRPDLKVQSAAPFNSNGTTVNLLLFVKKQ